VNRRTIVIAATAAMLAAGGIVGGVLAAQPVTTPVAALTSTAQGREGGWGDRPERDLPTATPTPSLAPEPPPAVAPAPAPPPAPPTADPAEAEVFAIVNQQRAANGCAPLAWDEGLAGVARSHSADMAARDYFSHVSPEGLDPFQRAAAAGQTARAENIAAGQPTAAGVMDSWMSSPGHRANILNCSLSRLGVGVGHGGSYGITWTQLFG
jgi:uncharacterized protein YkwD